MRGTSTAILLLLLCLNVSAQWNSNVAVNLELAGHNVSDLQTATTSDGKTWIAYYNNNAGNYDMRAQLLDVNGNKLLGPDGILACGVTSGSATFVFNVCLDLNDNLIISFQYQVAGITNAVVTKVMQNGTLPWGAAGTVLGPGLSPSAVVLSSNETVVAWNNSTPATLYMQKVSEGGTTLWPAPIAIYAGTTNSTRGQLVSHANGYFTVVFQRRGTGVSSTLYAQRYNSDGVGQWGSPANAVQLGNVATTSVRYYSVINENDTTYVGYYASVSNHFRSYLQRINPDGTLPYGINGAPFASYTGTQEPDQATTNIAKAPGSPFVWSVSTNHNGAQTLYGIFVQKFNATTGDRLLDVNGKEVYPINANRQTQVGTLNLVNGEPVFMHYDLDYKIYATRVNDAGNTVWATTPVVLSTTTATLAVPKGRFAFSKIVNNQAVALWTENRGTENRGYAQNILASGNTGPSGPAPVTLLNFRGAGKGKNIELSWKTFTENNNLGFYVQRSASGINFENIAFVSTKAAGGTSTNAIEYTLLDIAPFAGTNYYRLKQQDRDGRVTYSSIINIKLQRNGIIISSIYPIPVGDLLNISIDAESAAVLAYEIIDLKGSVAAKNLLSVKQGNNLMKINASSLAAGIYTIRFSADGEMQTRKFYKE